ncbi:pyridoxamine 5'-phosphate oxidase family protein [Halopenitus sp. POP-27]|uniref:pyridoxamine 5'-phosphate oxidase family protein n=1 Tax=Halopenitus sp. POP-27 TaxID=2994425 RepID=UPI002469354C|nr:pyridoxamine 5'-phosphate oxidase family protein [Halopenitus sp. POP-27]
MAPDVIQLGDDERDEFLGAGGTGVLSFSTDTETPPHSIPVSYGYDSADEAFYFRLATGVESRKGDPADRSVSFVAYGQREDRWNSVVAEGRLVATTDDDVALEALQGLERVHIPFVEIFGAPPETIDFEFYRLDPEELTARTEQPVRR